jgi:hypothetical protein
MMTRHVVFALGCSTLAIACTAQPDETQETIDNLIAAGYPADDIAVVDDIVYVGRDAQVSLLASQEMLQTRDSSEEQYRTNNVVGPSVTKICVNGATFTGVFSTALDLAIQNYDELPLSFAMARTPSTGCSVTINAVLIPGLMGGFSGFPAGGLPFPTINIGDGIAALGADTIEQVITHELGHTLGLRHSDFFDRTISCGGGGNEGDAGVGANLVPGTPSGATVGGSVMNACFRASETGEFTSSDLTTLKTLYGAAALAGAFRVHAVDNHAFGGNFFAETFPYVIGGSCAPHFVRAGTPTTQWTSQVGGFCNFQGWLSPENPHDCRASLLAHTAGGGFGGTCLGIVFEVQTSFDFSAGNTNSAQANTVNQAITLNAGQTLTFGTCGVPDASFNGDTFLRVFDPSGAQVALTDDACGGLGSRSVVTAATGGAYQIRTGCYSSSSCSGTVAWTIE